MTSSNQKILVKGHSELLKYILVKASQRGTPLTLYILETRPQCDGYRMFDELQKLNIQCKLVVDSAIGVILEDVDYVISGAEAVTENGGVINKIGTYTLAICANAMKKPVYVFAENYKFLRTFVINQSDIPKDANLRDEFTPCQIPGVPNLRFKKEDVVCPSCDFTPNNLISFIVSDSRIFKTSCVSDEFLQLFNL